MVFRFATILILTLASNLYTKGLNQAPMLVRACMNISDSTVTIDYTSISDVCGSFVEHNVYGSENGVTFNVLSIQKNFSATSIQFKTPNANPTWSFFFETRFKCNGSDTAKSNIISLDLTPPPKTVIDSVSIDFATQKPVVGWQKNPAKDTKGYRVYTQSNGINTPIGDTTNTLYFAENQTSNTITRYTFATFDSCNLFSAISERHSPMVLQTSLDTCTKSASLTWSGYEGWDTELQTVYTSLNGSTYQSTNISENDRSYSFAGINFGDSVCFFIRAINETPSRKSSSSNISCVKLYQPVIPKTTYLSNVTVVAKNNIEIEAYVENQGVADSLVLYRVESNPVRIGSKNLLKGNNLYSWNDQNVLTNESNSVYFVRTFAPCLGGTSASLNSNSILLSIDEETLSWNPYINWNGSVLEYEVFGFDGSTWNNVSTTLDNNYTNLDTNLQCFYIQAVENQNGYGFSRASKSNRVCAKRTPSYYIPNTVNPLSKDNHTLRVIGNSIDKENSNMIIFNRWGEQIFKTNDIQKGWSVDATNTFVPLGVYFYDVFIMDLNGNKHRRSGSVRVIR